MNHTSITFEQKVSEITGSSGSLSANDSEQLCTDFNISIEALMIRLLPIAAAYSRAAISNFKVGAVVCGALENEKGYSSLYLGSNIEYDNLSSSLHAEQSAVSNAWLDGQSGIKSIAVSAAPCGHCRQFLYELSGTKPLFILIPLATATDLFKIKEDGENSYAFAELTALLPAAFGPLDLGCTELMMESNLDQKELVLTKSSDDKLINLALEAATLSYAPYSSNFAGCAFEVASGELYSGRYAENAAFNPSLSPFTAVLSKTILSQGGSERDFDYKDIKRVVLVESPSQVTQKQVTTNLLSVCNDRVQLEYHQTVASH